MTTVVTKSRFTPEDLNQLEEEGRFELVDGKLVEKNMSLLANLTAGKVLVALSNFSATSSLGFAVAEQSFQCFPNDRELIRRPDVAFILTEPMPADWTQGHVSVAPDIAIEVVSPTDSVYGLDEKLADYRSAGVKLVWVINPSSRTMRIHRPDRSVTELDESGVLGGESVLPGFSVRLAEILPTVPASLRGT